MWAASSMEKESLLIEGRVCAECQNYPDTTLFVVDMLLVPAGGGRGRARLAPTKTFALACDINLGREVDVPASVI